MSVMSKTSGITENQKPIQASQAVRDYIAARDHHESVSKAAQSAQAEVDRLTSAIAARDGRHPLNGELQALLDEQTSAYREWLAAGHDGEPPRPNADRISEIREIIASAATDAGQAAIRLPQAKNVAEKTYSEMILSGQRMTEAYSAVLAEVRAIAGADYLTAFDDLVAAYLRIVGLALNNKQIDKDSEILAGLLPYVLHVHYFPKVSTMKEGATIRRFTNEEFEAAKHRAASEVEQYVAQAVS